MHIPIIRLPSAVTSPSAKTAFRALGTPRDPPKRASGTAKKASVSARSGPRASLSADLQEHAPESTLLTSRVRPRAVTARVGTTTEGTLHVVRFAQAYVPIWAISATVLDRLRDEPRRFWSITRPLMLQLARTRRSNGVHKHHLAAISYQYFAYLAVVSCEYIYVAARMRTHIVFNRMMPAPVQKSGEIRAAGNRGGRRRALERVRSSRMRSKKRNNKLVL